MSLCETTAIDPAERLRREYARGEFAFWNPEYEAIWRAEAGARPHAPVLPDGHQRIQVKPSQTAILRRFDSFGTFDAIIEAGKSYLVGKDVPTDTFLASHTEKLKPWQRVAYQWAIENPLWKLCVDSGPFSWVVRKGGHDYVDLSLPHHDAGGEKDWASRDGETMVLINVD